LWSKGFTVEEWWIDNEGKRHETANGLGPVNTWTDKVAAYCKITRPNGVAITRAFSVGMAKTAKLWDRREKVRKGWGTDAKDVDNDAAWFRYPDRMLRARAIGFAAKDGAADAMRGMMTSEEALDIQRTQEERDRDTLRPIETSVPAIPFDITLDVPARDQNAQPAIEEAEMIPNGNTDGAEEDVGEGGRDEPEVVPDDEQALSRATEAKLILDITEGLLAASCPGDVTAIERKIAPLAGRISEDARDTLVEQIQQAKQRVTS
jgi:hypothetical protein